MQFLIVAYDGTDSEAKQRRLNARAGHLEGVAKLKEAGSWINGGAILDEKGEMIGSTLYLNFATRQELEQWLEHDPYTTGGVWKKVAIEMIRLV